MSTINLLPDNYLERRCRRRAKVICLILFAIIMGAVVTAKAVSEQSRRHTLDVSNRITAEYRAAAKLIIQLQQFERRKAKLLHKITLSSSLLERLPKSRVLAAVTNALPTDTSLLCFDMNIRRVITKADADKASRKRTSKFDARKRKRKASAPTVGIVVTELTGLAGTDIQVARFIANLARNPLVASVDLVYSQEKLIEKFPVREFQIVMKLHADADVKNAGSAVTGAHRTASRNGSGRIGTLACAEPGGEK